MKRVQRIENATKELKNKSFFLVSHYELLHYYIIESVILQKSARASMLRLFPQAVTRDAEKHLHVFHILSHESHEIPSVVKGFLNNLALELE